MQALLKIILKPKLTDNNLRNLLVLPEQYYFFVIYCIWSRNKTKNNAKQFHNHLLHSKLTDWLV